MGKISNKLYAEKVASLERMADGIQQHGGEANFPPALDEAAVRNRKTTIEDKRQNYETLLNQAERAYDEFAAYSKECDAEMAKWNSALYSFYGKRDPRLADFGVSPWKVGKRNAAEEQLQE